MADVVFINTFEVDPAQHDELRRVLKEGVESVIRRREGFISSMILASADHKRIVNVTRWRAKEDIQAAQTDASVVAYGKRAAELAKGSPIVLAIAAEYQA